MLLQCLRILVNNVSEIFKTFIAEARLFLHLQVKLRVVISVSVSSIIRNPLSKQQLETSHYTVGGHGGKLGIPCCSDPLVRSPSFYSQITHFSLNAKASESKVYFLFPSIIV